MSSLSYPLSFSHGVIHCMVLARRVFHPDLSRKQNCLAIPRWLIRLPALWEADGSAGRSVGGRIEARPFPAHGFSSRPASNRGARIGVSGAHDRDRDHRSASSFSRSRQQSRNGRHAAATAGAGGLRGRDAVLFENVPQRRFKVSISGHFSRHRDQCANYDPHRRDRLPSIEGHQTGKPNASSGCLRPVMAESRRKNSAVQQIENLEHTGSIGRGKVTGCWS